MSLSFSRAATLPLTCDGAWLVRLQSAPPGSALDSRAAGGPTSTSALYYQLASAATAHLSLSCFEDFSTLVGQPKFNFDYVVAILTVSTLLDAYLR